MYVDPVMVSYTMMGFRGSRNWARAYILWLAVLPLWGRPKTPLHVLKSAGSVFVPTRRERTGDVRVLGTLCLKK